MFNIAIFKQGIKDYHKIWLVLTVVSSLFMAVVIFMVKSRPELQLPGSQGGSLLNVIGGAYYGVMGLLLFLAYVITSGNGLIAKEVDNGDMSYILNSPITRKRIILTKALFHIISITCMVLALSIVGSISGYILLPNKMEYGLFWLMNLGLFLYLFAIGGLSFFASCWFDKVSKSLVVGGGIPIAFFLISTVAGFGEDFELLKYFTLNSLFNITNIISGEGYIVEFVILLVLGLILYSLGVLRFIKKDLPL